MPTTGMQSTHYGLHWLCVRVCMCERESHAVCLSVCRSCPTVQDVVQDVMCDVTGKVHDWQEMWNSCGPGSLSDVYI